MPQRITEATGAVGQLTGKTQLVTIITPGWGASGYYSAEVLEKATAEKVWPAGTLMHIDHPTLAETTDRPERSVSTVGSRLIEDAHWNAAEKAVQARVRVVPQWRETLADLMESIGASIYTMAETEPGEAEGRHGNIVTRLIPDPFNTVDYVTVPGRGGRIAAVLEAAREATHNETRDQLRDALRNAYGTDGRYVWLVDSDDTTAWFEMEDPDRSATYQQAYRMDGEAVVLDGEPTEVTKRVTWVPVTTDPPAVPAGETHENTTEGNTKESDMPEITQEELTQLRENASRATQLEAENKDLRENADKAAREARVERATGAVREAFGADAPTFYVTAAERAAATEDYNHEAFTAMVNEAAAARDAANGAGEVTGAGNTTAAEAYVRPSDTDRTDDILAIRV